MLLDAMIKMRRVVLGTITFKRIKEATAKFARLGLWHKKSRFGNLLTLFKFIGFVRRNYSSSASSKPSIACTASKEESKIKIALPSVSIIPCSSRVFKTRPTISREQPTIRPIS